MTEADIALGKEIEAHINNGKNVTRSEIRKKFGAAQDKCLRLVSAGLLHKYPKALNRNIAATMNRAKKDPYAGWQIKV